MATLHRSASCFATPVPAVIAHAYRAQAGGGKHVTDGAADAALVDDQIAVIAKRRPVQHVPHMLDESG